MTDATTIKTAAAGRWQEILAAVGMPPEVLTGKNCPCPKCGGTDRFRFINPDAGACFCNQCFDTKNGDGLAAVQWWTGESFPAAVHAVAEFLGLNGANGTNGHSGNGKAKPASNGKPAPYATAADAIESLQRHRGAPSGCWNYENAAGETVGYTLRWEKPSGGKDILPLSRRADGWIVGAMPGPRPLYKLAKLADAERVYIVEGEKTVDAANSIGLVATTSAGGCQATGKADWRPLAGKECVILPDNDPPGRSYARAVAGILAKLTPPATCKIIELPGDLPDGGDLADVLADPDWCGLPLNAAAEPRDLAALLNRLADDAPAVVADATEGTEGEQTPPVISYRRITSAQLDAAEFNTEYLVNGVLVAGQPCIIAGPQKALKTSLIIDLAVSIDRGGKFLGYFDCTRPTRVGVMSGESGMATIQETARRVCHAAGCQLSDCGIIWSDDLPRFGAVEHVDAIARFIEADGLEVLAIDPAYLAMPSGDAGNVFAQGELLHAVSVACQSAGCALLLAHHTRKNGTTGENRAPELADIAWAGFAEFARQWLLVGRRERYEPGSGEHLLWLAVGGSAGHGGLYGIDVNEGTRDDLGGRRWETTVRSTTETEAESQRVKAEREAERQEQAERRNIDKLRTALRRFPDGETARVLRTTAGLNPDNFATSIRTLLGEGRAEACQVAKGSRNYDGFRPTKHT